MDFTTKRLKIVEISADHIAEIHQLNSYEKVAAFNTIGIPTNIEVTEEFIKPIIEDRRRSERTTFGWVIRSKETDEFIGQVGMNLAPKRFKMAEIHYSVVPYSWGNGYATECVKAVINFGFEILKLHRIEAGVATKNENSIKVLEKVGMTREGMKRKVLPLNNGWSDNYHYSILIEDKRGY